MWIMTTSGPHGSAAARLLQAVVLPAGLDHRLERAARRLLVQQRHAVGEADHAGRLVARQVPP
jgi:hypothetical protein